MREISEYVRDWPVRVDLTERMVWVDITDGAAVVVVVIKVLLRLLLRDVGEVSRGRQSEAHPPEPDLPRSPRVFGGILGITESAQKLETTDGCYIPCMLRYEH